MTTFNSLVVGTARGFKDTSRKALRQAGNQAKSNAELQSFLVTNTARQAVPDSRTSNPAKSNENEKHDLAETQRQKLKDHLGSASTWLLKGLVPSLAGFAAAGVPMLDALVTLPAKAADLAALRLKIGMHRSHGWEMKRLTDAWTLFSKFMKVTAETAIHFRAPAVFVSADTHHVAATLSLEVVDVKTVVAQEEIHRVANAFGLEATHLVALLQAAATIHANGKLELATATDATLSAGTNVNLVAGNALHHSAITHTFADAAGGSIKLSGGRIDLNPLVPAALPAVPVVVLPVVPVSPSQQPAATKQMPQYDGLGAHGSLLT
jgi:hypothetical protein